MTDQNGDPIMVEVLVEKKTESNHSASGKRVTVDGKTYLFGDNGLIYRVNTSANSLSVVNSFKSGHNLSSIKNSLEEMMADTDSLKEDMKKNELYDDSKSQTDNYNTLYDAFITYLLGNVEFEISSDDVTDAQTVSIPLYFTATIRESPQANFYYKNNGTKVTCNAGEYYYKREHWFFGKWYSNECYTDGKVNSKKDTAKSAKSAGKTDEEKYNYYTTSVLIADIVISIDSEGKTAVELQWQ